MRIDGTQQGGTSESLMTTAPRPAGGMALSARFFELHPGKPIRDQHTGAALGVRGFGILFRPLEVMSEAQEDRLAPRRGTVRVRARIIQVTGVWSSWEYTPRGSDVMALTRALRNTLHRAVASSEPGGKELMDEQDLWFNDYGSYDTLKQERAICRHENTHLGPLVRAPPHIQDTGGGSNYTRVGKRGSTPHGARG